MARLGDGWIAAARSPEGLASGRAALAERARALGRDPSAISVNMQIWIALGRDRAGSQAQKAARGFRSRHRS